MHSVIAVDIYKPQMLLSDLQKLHLIYRKCFLSAETVSDSYKSYLNSRNCFLFIAISRDLRRLSQNGCLGQNLTHATTIAVIGSVALCSRIVQVRLQPILPSKCQRSPRQMIAVGTYELYASTNGQDQTTEFHVTITVTYRVHIY